MLLSRFGKSGSLRGFVPAVVSAIIIVGFGFVEKTPAGLALGVNITLAAISAVGLTLIIGGAGQLSLGQAGFMGIGAYGTADLMATRGWPFVLAVAASVLAALLVGLMVGYIALRLQGNYLAMATLALGAGIFALLLLPSFLGGANGFAPIPPAEILGFKFLKPRDQYLLVAVMLVIVLFLVQALLSSRAGREFAAMRDDEVAAKTIGINITSRKVQVFAVASAIGGLAGAINGPIQTAIDPYLFSPAVSLQLFVIVVIGGLGNIYGAVFGSAFVIWLISVVPGSGSWALFVLGVTVVVFMAVLPDGLPGIFRLLRVGFARIRSRARSQPPSGAGGDGTPAEVIT